MGLSRCDFFAGLPAPALGFTGGWRTFAQACNIARGYKRGSSMRNVRTRRTPIVFVLAGLGACLPIQTLAADSDPNRANARSDVACEARDGKSAVAQPRAKQRRHSAKPSSTPGSDTKWAM